MHFDIPEPIHPSYASGPQGVWSNCETAVVVGDAGHVFVFHDGAWLIASGSEQGIWRRWFDIEAIASDNVWFFGLGTSMHFDGRTFATIPTAPTDWRQDFMGSFASAPNDLWIVGIGQWGDNVQHYDGTSFSRVDVGALAAGSDWILDVWGSGPSDIYFAGESNLFHWDGREFASAGLGASPHAVHGTSATDVWVVAGTGGHPSWTQLNHDNVWWHSLHAIAPDDVWAAGGGATEHWDGHTWSRVDIPAVTTPNPWDAPSISAFLTAEHADFGDPDRPTPVGLQTQVLATQPMPPWRLMLWVKLIEAVVQLRPRTLYRVFFEPGPRLRHAMRWYTEWGVASASKTSAASRERRSIAKRTCSTNYASQSPKLNSRWPRLCL
ncbi:MAG: hypothetical protein IPK13_08480 [Deltaproteobacteria bacterium]|nr:hypothetical protein [Deltaproteobacteria bacterium]